MKIPLQVSPTDFHSTPNGVIESEPSPTKRSGQGRSVGTIVHRLLQDWNFDLDATAQMALINRQTLALGAHEATQEGLLRLMAGVGAAPAA